MKKTRRVEIIAFRRRTSVVLREPSGDCGPLAPEKSSRVCDEEPDAVKQSETIESRLAVIEADHSSELSRLIESIVTSNGEMDRPAPQLFRKGIRAKLRSLRAAIMRSLT